jgi:excisionase family DNA binding protein
MMNERNERRWLSVREVAERLALHPQTIYELFRQKKLPGGHIGRVVRLDWRAIEAGLEGLPYKGALISRRKQCRKKTKQTAKSSLN